MSEFLTNEQLKEFVELGGIMKCMELIEEGYAKPQSMSPKCFFPTLKEMGYEKVIYCKDCIHRPYKHWKEDEYEIVAPKNQKGKNDYTCYCSWLHIIPDNNFYCGFGEKMTNQKYFEQQNDCTEQDVLKFEKIVKENLNYPLTPCGWPPDYSLKTKVIQCKHCIKRGDPVMCPMCYEELNDGDWIIHDRTTDYGFCHLGEQEDVFKREN